ncbi:MAG: hypothetical protein QXG58_05375 [Candidatus Bathyarchaeia archaeon]
MKKCTITLALFSLWAIVIVHDVDAGVNAVIIPPMETFSLNINLNNSSSIHGSFYAVNGIINFLFSAPDGKVLFEANNTCNGTINFEASKTGTYVLRILNPSEEHAVEVIYPVKLCNNITVSLTLKIQLVPPLPLIHH